MPSLLTATPARQPLYLLLAILIRVAEADVAVPACMRVVLLPFLAVTYTRSVHKFPLMGRAPGWSLTAGAVEHLTTSRQ
jgi:hypothetical protein